MKRWSNQGTWNWNPLDIGWDFLVGLPTLAFFLSLFHGRDLSVLCLSYGAYQTVSRDAREITLLQGCADVEEDADDELEEISCCSVQSSWSSNSLLGTSKSTPLLTDEVRVTRWCWSIFYEKHLGQLIDVITASCPQEGIAQSASSGGRVESTKPEILSNICELLCFCVLHHPYRIK